MRIVRSDVHQKYDGHCAYCGVTITIKQMQVDHIIPRRLFSKEHDCFIIRARKFTDYGLNDFRNLAPSCALCNNFKSGMSLEQFRSELSKQPERLRRYRNQFKLAERFGLVVVIDQPIVFFFERQINLSDK